MTHFDLTKKLRHTKCVTFNSIGDFKFFGKKNCIKECFKSKRLSTFCIYQVVKPCVKLFSDNCFRIKFFNSQLSSVDSVSRLCFLVYAIHVNNAYTVESEYWANNIEKHLKSGNLVSGFGMAQL